MWSGMFNAWKRSRTQDKGNQKVTQLNVSRKTLSHDVSGPAQDTHTEHGKYGVLSVSCLSVVKEGLVSSVTGLIRRGSIANG